MLQVYLCLPKPTSSHVFKEVLAGIASLSPATYNTRAICILFVIQANRQNRNASYTHINTSKEGGWMSPSTTSYSGARCLNDFDDVDKYMVDANNFCKCTRLQVAR